MDYFDSGNRPTLSRFPASKSHKYLTFDVDIGGLNNIRMAFEYVVVLAAICGRTLVLPPSQPWYLLNFGPIHDGVGTSGYGDIFDIPILASAVPVISVEQFISLEKNRLNIPIVFSQLTSNSAMVNSVASRTVKQWKSWLFEHSNVMPWNPYNDLLCLPTIESAQKNNVLSESLIDGRSLVEFDSEMLEADIIYFPSNKECRQLGQVATMLVSTNPGLCRETRRLLKYHVRYIPEIFQMAKKLVDALPAKGYNSLHIRRNDFQYNSSRTHAEETFQNVESLYSENQPLYIATDENNESFFNVFERNRPIYRWDDFFTSRCGRILKNEAVPFEWIGILEQIICAHGQRFVGTKLSTFSSYIVRLRGYLDAFDKNTYFHTESYNAPYPDSYKPIPLTGRQYLQESPLMWENC